MISFRSHNSIVSIAVMVTLSLMLLLSTTVSATENVALSKPHRQQVGIRGIDSRLLQNSGLRRIEQEQKERPGIYRGIGSTVGGPKSSKATPVPIPSTSVVEDNETSNSESVSSNVGSTEATETVESGSSAEAIETEDVDSSEVMETESVGSAEATETVEIGSSAEATETESEETVESGSSSTEETVDASSNSFVISLPNETSEATETVDDGTAVSAVVCKSLNAQEPPLLENLDTFLVTAEVVYEAELYDTLDIESSLSLSNSEMAMQIILYGCEDEANDNTIKTAEGKRRNLVGGSPSIGYAQVGTWESIERCDKPLCETDFVSEIQINSEDASSDDLKEIIASAFGDTTKPFLESQEGVESVSIVDISLSTSEQESTDAINTNPIETTPVRNRSTTKIIMGTIAGACLLSSLILFILIGTYQRRRRGMKPRTNKDVAHIPFEDEFDGDAEVMDRVIVTNKGIEKPNDQQDDSDDSLPCPYALGIPVPYDERRMCSSATCPDCERLRREGIVGRSPSAPVQFSAPTAGRASPRFEPQWWKLRPDADASRRNYEHEDAMEL